ncbi:MAG TPA: SpoIIE family protein phosphatase [Gemmataceae bacterium]|nr:SpoIIE family protein phosphatase [Gemmataceae bacterium]
MEHHFSEGPRLPSDSSRILLCAASPTAAADVRRLLEEAGLHVADHFYHVPVPDDLADYHLAVLEGCGEEEAALAFCRRLRSRLADRLLPILFITDDRAPHARLASLEGGADTYLLRPFSPAELLGQVRAFLRLKELHERLSEKTAEVRRINHRLRQAYQTIDQELELARRVQLSFLPPSLPEVPECRFAVHYDLRGKVGGDFYDVFRLDESHLGFYVADAVGHGVAASLLTIFVKKGVRAKDVIGRQYRLVPPNEVLQRLNRDLVAQAMAEAPFITMVYALLDHRTGTLHFARAGHPHPLYLPCEGPPQLWQVEGSLMGVFDIEFPVQVRQLHPGDKLLLYSDGIDAARFEDQPSGIVSLLACAARHRQLPIEAFVERLATDLFREGGQPDDLTLLGLEMNRC